MKYMLMMYFEEDGALTQEQREKCYVESAAFAQKLHESGKFLGAAPFSPLPRPPAFAFRTASAWSPMAPLRKPASSLAASF